MITTSPNLTTDLSLDETLERLANAEDIDRLALFGSRLGEESNPISDNDLPILLHETPAHIFQMLTHINGRMADVVFVEADAVDKLLTLDEPIEPPKRSHYLVQKMLVADIVYDPSHRLSQ